MRTNKNFILREIAGEALLIPTGEETKRLNGMIQLSDVGVFIWKNADQTEGLASMIQKVLEEYEVDEATAVNDVTEFLAELMMRGMLFDVPDLEIHTPDEKPIDFNMQISMVTE